MGTDAVQTIKVVVILVDFSDNLANSGVSGLTPASFDDLLFSQHPSDARTLTDFYIENSYGKLIVDGDVFGWYRMPHLYSEYVGTGYGLQMTQPNAATLVRDAVTAADPSINFSNYANPMGAVDAVFVIHAGKGAEEGGDHNCIWSHRSSLSPAYISAEGIVVSSYIVGPEEEFGGQTRIGVYCHEFGHILTLPDLYDVGPAGLPGLGRWSLMASGSWNGNGQWPANLDGWCKYTLNFGRTINVLSNLADVTLNAATTDTLRYILKLPPTDRESFVVENRQRVGFDRDLPGSGLLILHVDGNLSGSNNMQAYGHWHVSVEQADGLYDLENGVNEGDVNDLWPGPQGLHTEFTNLTVPNTMAWTGVSNQLSVWNISENTGDKTVTCNLEVNYSRTNIQLLSTTFSDAAYGNNDSVLAAGERVQLFYTVKNFWKDASGVTITVTTPTPGISFTSNQNYFDSIPSGQVRSDSTAPIDFTISPSMPVTNARFDMTIVTVSPADTFLSSFDQYVGSVDAFRIERILIEGDPNSGHVVNHTPTFTWQYTPFDTVGQVSFEIAVGTDSDWTVAEMWSPPLFNSSDTSVVYAGAPLVDGTTYWLRLRVLSSLAWSNWKQISFHMNSMPTVPQLRLPQAGQVVTVQQPCLTIRNSIDADFDPSQAQYPPVVLTDRWTDFASSSVKINGQLAPTGTVVDAFDPQGVHCGHQTLSQPGFMMPLAVYGDDDRTPLQDEGCVLGDTVTFRVNGIVATAPNSDVVWTGLGPLKMIQLSTPSDSLLYSFEVSPDSFATRVFTFLKRQDPDTLTLLVVDSVLQEDAKFWWRARASDYYEQSGYSDIRSFYVNSTNTPPTPVTALTPPNSLITPVVTLRPLFTWTASIDPDPYDTVTYDLIIDLDSNFTSLPQVENLTSTSYTMTTDLQWGTRYWWNVRSADRHGGYTWAPVPFTFRTVTLGDANNDGSVNVADAVFLLNYIFADGSPPQPLFAGDANCDETVNIVDGVYLINYIFADGPAPCGEF